MTRHGGLQLYLVLLLVTAAMMGLDGVTGGCSPDVELKLNNRLLLTMVHDLKADTERKTTLLVLCTASCKYSYIYIYIYIYIYVYIYIYIYLSCVVQYRRPNGRANRDQNWHKYSLGLCDEYRGVGGRVARAARNRGGAAIVWCCAVRYRQPNGWADQHQHYGSHTY
jgi:hypothetical protein